MRSSASVGTPQRHPRDLGIFHRPMIATMRRSLLLLLLMPFAALAQSSPTQPVRVMVGFPPGGTTDIIGRLVANELSEQLGKPFVVEHLGVASCTIATVSVAKSTPYGHNLILCAITH